MLRVFTAIALTPACRTALEAARARLERAGVEAAWTPSDNLHLSLIFIGNIGADHIGDIAAALRTAAATVPAFAIMLRGLGTFGPPRAPRVLWAGIDAPTTLLPLHARLKAGLYAAGVSTEDRPYVPHVTLARFKPSHRRRNAANGAWPPPRELEPEPIVMTVDAIHLMQSDLHPDGARYTVLHSSHLGGVVPEVE